MARKLSHIAPDWWDYTTLDSELIEEAARLSERELGRLSRPGFKVVFYDTLEDFYLAEALEYIEFNIEGAYVGPHTPIVMWKCELEDIEERYGD